MKVKLLKPWIGKPVGAEIELSDEKAKRLIANGMVAKVIVRRPKVAKSKGDSDGSTNKVDRL